jgi:hypothetical protein
LRYPKGGLNEYQTAPADGLQPPLTHNVVLQNMNKILRTKIQPAVFVLLVLGLFFGSIFFFGDKTPLKWLAVFGCTVFFVAKIGQAFTSRKEKIGDVFSIFSKVGVESGVRLDY